MAETLQGEVIHVVPPEEQDDYEFATELAELAESRYVLVCREGGSPSWFEKIKSFLLGQHIEAVTLVSETAVPEGEELTAAVEETSLAGVYRVTDQR